MELVERHLHPWSELHPVAVVAHSADNSVVVASQPLPPDKRHFPYMLVVGAGAVAPAEVARRIGDKLVLYSLQVSIYTELDTSIVTYWWKSIH